MYTTVTTMILLTVSALLGGCVSRETPDSQLHQILSPPNQHSARLVFFRTRDSKLYILRSATVSVDSKTVGETPFGGFHYVDVEAGTRQLKASMWDSPGSCILELDASPGHVYFFQVDPRAESFGAFSAGDIASGALVDEPILRVLGGILASSAESYGKDCGGAFRLYPVDPITAESRIRTLRVRK